MSNRRGGLFTPRSDGRNRITSAPEFWSYTAASGVAKNQDFTGISTNDLIVASGKTLTITAVAIFTDNGGASNGTSCHLAIWTGATTKILDVDFSSSGSAGWALVAGTFRAQEITPLALTAGTYRIALYDNTSLWNSSVGSPGAPFTPETYGGHVSYGSSFYGGGSTGWPSGSGGSSPNPYYMVAIVRGSIA